MVDLLVCRGDSMALVTLKEQMAGGSPVLGLIVRAVRSPRIVPIAVASGHDFLFVDTQHGVFDLETVESITAAAASSGLAVLVRVGGPADDDIGRLLDCGAAGIVVPDVETAEQAAEAVSRCRFPPVGRRSVVSGWPSFGGVLPAGLSPAEAMAAADEAVVLACMIESRAGLANLDEIAAVDGVDVLHVGCNDLAADLGIPGAYTDPRIVEAIASVVKACRRHGRFAGLGGDRDPARQANWAKAGVRFLTIGSDAGYLAETARAKTADLRSRISADG